MKVCILAAGRGTRMGTFAGIVHKGLLPLGNMAVISRIISQFSPSDSFVIALGYKEEQVRNYLAIAHPDLDLTYVSVTNYEGPGSGPGHSLFCCRQSLQEPFVFSSCDTLITSPIPSTHENWVGIYPISDPKLWCTVTIEEDLVKSFHYKVAEGSKSGFVGIAGVYDFRTFWESFTSESPQEGSEYQVDSGLKGLIPKGIKGKHLGWLDTGNEQAFQSALAHYEKNLTFAGKTTDITYRIGPKVIKYFPSEGVAKKRFKRAQNNSPFFGEVLDQIEGFYSYSYVQGQVLTEDLCYNTVHRFLNWAQESFWKDLKVDSIDWQNVLREFYFEKTADRLRKFLNMRPEAKEWEKSSVLINGIQCLPVCEILEASSSALVSDAIPSTYHGDLHTDNIIVTQEHSYVMIDWRDSFGSSNDVGDRYYDLAKFLHTLELSVKCMENRRFEVKQHGQDELSFDHDSNFTLYDGMRGFWRFVDSRKYNKSRIELINALIYINMAPLYDQDLALYLYVFGRYQLNICFQHIS